MWTLVLTVFLLLCDGRVIPTGTTVGINIHMVQNDSNHFPDPDTFNPDRFLPENCVGRHPYAFCPFSAGPRNCIGIYEKIGGK